VVRRRAIFLMAPPFLENYAPRRCGEQLFVTVGSIIPTVLVPLRDGFPMILLLDDSSNTPCQGFP
jgi:hypothetical protein